MSSRPVFSLRLPRATKDALYRNGYETVQDVISAAPTSIARDLNISNMEAEAILKQAQGSSMPHNGVPLTQSAATIVNSMRKFTTRWPPLDKLLKGGIVHGHILEISGPPGCPKETMAIDIMKSVLQAGESVIFVDCQNMTCASEIRSSIISAGLDSHLTSLKFIRLLTATEVMVFLNSINAILDSSSKPKPSLLVFNSLSFPFSTLPHPRFKPGIMEQVGRILSHVSAVHNLAVNIFFFFYFYFYFFICFKNGRFDRS
ncbi:hypothetical protein Ac2012v2_006776 [Leucoagaricus gongylophorus]